MTKDEANKYRYLEGVDCNVFSSAVIVASLVTATESLGLPRFEIHLVYCTFNADLLSAVILQLRDMRQRV